MANSDQDDVRCMERLKEGDDLALNELMQRWKEPLISFALRYTGNRTDAREIAHETFVKVYGARNRYRASAAFSTWMFTIATNLCRMRARWRSRHPEVLQSDGEFPGGTVGEKAAYTVDPGTQSDRNTLAADLKAAIQNLPHQLRTAFVLNEISGRNHREIARVLKCSAKAVERKLARARERLRAELEPVWRP